MVIGHETYGGRCVDQKQYCRVHSLAGQGREFQEMLPPPLCDRVRKHGYAPAEEGAGLDFKHHIPSPFPEEEVKPAVPYRMLGLDDNSAVKAREPVVLDQVPGHKIVLVRVKQDRAAISLYRHSHVCYLPFGNDRLFHEVQFSSREQEFPELAGIRKVRYYGPTLYRTFYHEAIRSCLECGGYDISEKLHVTILPEQDPFVTSRYEVGGQSASNEWGADDIRKSDLDTNIHPDGAREWLAAKNMIG
jgi:hypothetical protein